MTSPLISCKTCGKEISPKAAACPHCGAPVKKKLGCIHLLGIGTGLGILVLVAAAMLSEGTGTGGGSSAAPAKTVGRLNEPVAAGTMEWTITNAKAAAGFSSDGVSIRAESGDSVLVLVGGTAVNRSDREVTYIGNLYLIDDKGARYGERADAVPLVKPFDLASFNPNVPRKFSTMFEVPRSATGLKFEATDFGPIQAETALIDLGLALK